MPLSSVVGAQSIVRPGVCTSSTRPASPYDGQVIYETDTDKTLVWNGSGWVFLSTSRSNPVGLDLVKTQTVGSAVSTVQVTGAFSATYDNYLITYNDGTSSATNNLNLLLGATTSGYYTTIFGSSWSATFSATGSTTNTKFERVGEMNTTTGSNMFVQIQSPYLAKRTRVEATYLTTTGAYTFLGMLDNTTSYTDFTMTPESGTITGGTIRVYGYVNS